jgi:hypothetical protein
VVLRDASGAIVDVVKYGPQPVLTTLGRIDGKLALNLPSPGDSNTVAQLRGPESLVINEWLADSEAGQPDWIEIFNTDEVLPVALQGLFLSVSNQIFEITSAAFIDPGGYVQLFADEAPEADSLDFKLQASGGTIRLLDPAGRELTSITYDQQQQGVSEGRYPDATENIIRFPITPTPGAANQLRFPVSVSAAANEITLSWPSVAGRVYRVERSEDLANWAPHREVTATEGTTSAGEPSSENSRYFRVIALP